MALPASSLLLLLLYLSLSSADVACILSDNRPIIPLFELINSTGRLELNVSNISFSPNTHLNLSQLGFLLISTHQNLSCPIQYANLTKPVFSFDSIKPLGANNFTTNVCLCLNQNDHYSLIAFANCLPNLNVSMTIQYAIHNNLDEKSSERPCKDRYYFSLGTTLLPRDYFLLSIPYFFLSALWLLVLLKNRLSTPGRRLFKIHFFLLLVVALKALTVFCEAVYKTTGSPDVWDFLFYTFGCAEMVSFFSLAVLIGSGWSFWEPRLRAAEKVALPVLILLQLGLSAAQETMDKYGPYNSTLRNLELLVLIGNLVSLLVVFFHTAWSLKKLLDAARAVGGNGRKAAAVSGKRLILLRSLCLTVICCVLYTRVVVYGLEMVTPYGYRWIFVVAGELAMLVFYVYLGCKLKPGADNPYFAADDEEEEATATAEGGGARENGGGRRDIEVVATN